MRVHIVHFLYSLSFIPTVKDSKWVTATNTVSCQARAGSSIPSGISKTALSNTKWDTSPTCLLFQFNTETPVLLFRLPKSVSQKHKKDHHSDSLLCAKLSLYSHSMGQTKNIWMPVQIIIAACKYEIYNLAPAKINELHWNLDHTGVPRSSVIITSFSSDNH